MEIIEEIEDLILNYTYANKKKLIELIKLYYWRALMITYIQKRFKKFSFLLCGFYTYFKFLL
jgi:hypothetical protein